MPKRLVIHALFTYTDPSSKRRRTAFRGEVINVGKEDLARGERFGAFGTEADLVPPGLDEGVVDLPAQEPTGTPVVPLVSKSAVLEAALRERLSVEPGANEDQVLAALDAALAKAQQPTETPTQQGPELAAAGDPGNPVIVNLPPTADDGTGEIVEEEPTTASDEPADDSDADEGPPPLAATKDRWVAYAVKKGMAPGEASAKNKADLIALYGGG